MREQIQQEEMMMTITGRDEMEGMSYPVHAKSSECDTLTCFLPNQGFVGCMIKAGRKGKIDESSPY